MGPIFIALDFGDIHEVWDFLDLFPSTEKLAVKIGMELFYAQGPQIIQQLQQRGLTIFLDLKLYDIPHTVEQAAYQLGRQKVDYLTVHAAGGSQMLQSAKKGLVAGSQAAGVPPAKLLAITQLTSLSEEQLKVEQQVAVSLPKSVTHLAQLAFNNGADGVIASALENQIIHQATSHEFLCINPGIRLKTDNADDQKRIATPTAAKNWGSNGLVVGRPITQAPDPLAAYQEICQQWRN